MELVIKITKKLYDRYKKTDHIKICELDEFEKALDKCIILPKGHGRLIDADAICKDIISALGIRDENYLLEAEKAVYKRIKNAPTIIEADKAESEVGNESKRFNTGIK